MILGRRVRAASIVLVVLAFASIAVRPSHAQQARFEWPDRAKNLKVFPKDTPKEKLRDTMVGFTRALGVRCPFCHVGQEGQPLTTYDFVSDEKPMKNVARGMVKMARAANKEIGKMKVQERNHVEVQCVTCHRGRPRPMTLSEELTTVYESAGIDSTVARYNLLHDRFYGAGSYDFSERSLNELGASLLARNRPDDAVRIFELNVQQNPNSSFAYSALGDAYAAVGKKDQAIQSYEKALQLEPRNQEADRKLRELRAGAK